MVSISHERPVESERRLVGVLRAAKVVHLEGAWCFRRFGREAPAAARATVRDDDGWCALAPAAADSGQRFGLTVTTFNEESENSGFVGWIATTVKRRLGTGVFVICGDNPTRGGIFDYLGYPIQIAGAVRGLIDDPRAPAPSDPFDLDLRLFEVVETSPASAISNETVFEFREHGGVVEATYAGGGIERGFLAGRRLGVRVKTAYSQLHAGGELRTGPARMRVERTAAGQLRLLERYMWSNGTRGQNVLQTVERAHGL